MNPRECQSYLESFINHELQLNSALRTDFKLERVRMLLNQLGNPPNSLKIIHVAGTKGKGSVCAMTASILKEAGYTVGLYTSPHMNHYRERIRFLSKRAGNRQPPPGVGLSLDVFNDMITEDELCGVMNAIKPAIETVQAGMGHLSFFEIYTVAALYYFYQNKADWTVLETGLGGRLDATNVCDSHVAVITPISLEHTHILGDTITQITREKAAIIKNRRQRVVIAPQTEEACDVLKDRCIPLDHPPVWVKDCQVHEIVNQKIDKQVFSIKTSKREYSNLCLPLLGGHQRINAATAVCVIESLQDAGVSIAHEAITLGLERVFWPGRFEVVHQKPMVILDGAHNVASAAALAELMRELCAGKNIRLVLGMSKDKDIGTICSIFRNITNDIIFTQADHPRAYTFTGAVSIEEALQLVLKQSAPDDVVLISGSLFVVAQARRIMSELNLFSTTRA